MSGYIKKTSSVLIKVNINRKNWDTLKEEISKGYVAQVGILGQSIHNRKPSEERKVTEERSPTKNNPAKHKKGKDVSDLTNADIGFLHEKGSLTKHIPRRSFIEMPLTLHLKDTLSKSMAVIQAAFEALDVRKAYTLLGIACENTIQEAFASHGFGKWKANSPATIARKGSSSPLIDTAQLRKSINSRVVVK